MCDTQNSIFDTVMYGNRWINFMSSFEFINSSQYKTYAIIKFAKPSQAEDAIEGMNHSWVGNSQISVRWDERPH